MQVLSCVVHECPSLSMSAFTLCAAQYQYCSIRTMQELLACVLTQLEAMTGTLASHGFGPLQEDYLQAWLHTNQQVDQQWLWCSG